MGALMMCSRRRAKTSSLRRELTLEAEVSAWFAKRNTVNAKTDWRFTTKDARIK